MEETSETYGPVGLRKRYADLEGAADYLSRKIFATDMTMSEYLQERVREWYRGYDKHEFPLLEWLGLSRDEYAAWITDDVLSDRVRRLQMRGYVNRILRGHP